MINFLNVRVFNENWEIFSDPIATAPYPRDLPCAFALSLFLSLFNFLDVIQKGVASTQFPKLSIKNFLF